MLEKIKIIAQIAAIVAVSTTIYMEAVKNMFQKLSKNKKVFDNSSLWFWWLTLSGSALFTGLALRLFIDSAPWTIDLILMYVYIFLISWSVTYVFYRLIVKIIIATIDLLIGKLRGKGIMISETNKKSLVSGVKENPPGYLGGFFQCLEFLKANGFTIKNKLIKNPNPMKNFTKETEEKIRKAIEYLCDEWGAKWDYGYGKKTGNPIPKTSKENNEHPIKSPLGTKSWKKSAKIPWPNEKDCLEFLKANGFTEKNGLIIPPESLYIPGGERADEAIEYLCNEWDYSYEPFKTDPKPETEPNL